MTLIQVNRPIRVPGCARLHAGSSVGSDVCLRREYNEGETRTPWHTQGAKRQLTLNRSLSGQLPFGKIQ
jgi:hypothetical protein